MEPDVRPLASDSPVFPNTRWSLVLQAGAHADEQARSALAHLCREYWYPLYAYVRRRGFAAHDAQDLTQSFMLEIIAGPLLGRADPDVGRFRSFMLGAMQNFLANAQRHQHAQRRGGEFTFVSIDGARGEGRYGLEPLDHFTAEDAFERNWALALLDTVLARLRGEYEAAGRAALFAGLQPYLAGKDGQAGYAALGRELGLSENTVAVSVHRLRRHYGELLRAEIAMTVATQEEIESEIAHLMAVLSR